jgi:hypothetical protein
MNRISRIRRSLAVLAALGAALVAAVGAVLLDRVRLARRQVTATAS